MLVLSQMWQLAGGRVRRQPKRQPHSMSHPPQLRPGAATQAATQAAVVWLMRRRGGAQGQGSPNPVTHRCMLPVHDPPCRWRSASAWRCGRGTSLWRPQTACLTMCIPMRPPPWCRHPRCGQGAAAGGCQCGWQVCRGDTAVAGGGGWHIRWSALYAFRLLGLLCCRCVGPSQRPPVPCSA